MAGAAFALARLPAGATRERLLDAGALAFASAGVVLHGWALAGQLWPGHPVVVTTATAVSLIGLQLAMTAWIAGFDARLRGLSAGLLLLAAVGALLTGSTPLPVADSGVTLQRQAHIMVSMFAYGLLTVGAIVAVYGLLLDRRLRAARLTAANRLFAPLETTERLLHGLTIAGFVALAMAVVSGITFVENFFAQHLVHKATLSIVATILFGVLLAGRLFAGWRGRRAVYWYLTGYVFLGFAYFGSRLILEQLLGRSWS